MEDKLTQVGEELRHKALPHDTLAQARRKGLQRAKRQRKQSIRVWSGVAIAAIFVLSFTLSIRLSPQFAQSMAKVPGVSLFVDLISTDKGVRDIISHDYYEVLNVAQTKGGLTFTLQGVIADTSGMVLNYKLESSKPVQNLSPQISILQDGSPLAASIGQYNSGDETKFEQGKLIHVVSPESISYENPNFELQVKIDQELETTFTLPFTLEKPIAKTKKVSLNQSLTFEGQELIVEAIAIAPLRAKVTIRVPEDNTMRLLDIEKLQLIDELGEIWKQGGIISAHGDLESGLVHYYLQSNYFREPKKLALEIGDIQALPKGDDYVEIDVEHGKVTHVPQFIEADIWVENDEIHVVMPARDEKESTFSFTSPVDARGETPRSINVVTGINDGKDRNIYMFDFEQMQSPIRLNVQNYPNYLEGEEKIDIDIK
ncbi:DUF4179 domain-containing protein [Lysinibacillus contaminans]|nr:DUF4179 domain-containing protein [Lysinibacillus contaminans]